MNPFSQAEDQVKFVIVVVDCMIKWVEVKTLKHLTQNDCLDFFMKEVVLWFRIPKVLIFDNDTQF